MDSASRQLSHRRSGRAWKNGLDVITTWAKVSRARPFLCKHLTISGRGDCWTVYKGEDLQSGICLPERAVVFPLWLLRSLISLHCLRYTPLAVLKIKDSGTAPGHWFLPEAREFSRPISAKSVFRQPGFPWNYPIGSRYNMTLFVGCGCGWACACACACVRLNAKISLFCASKSSLTASYFRLVVLNLLSLHVQLPQTKAAFPAHKYCDISRSERQKQIVSRRQHSTLQVSPGFSS